MNKRNKTTKQRKKKEKKRKRGRKKKEKANRIQRGIPPGQGTNDDNKINHLSPHLFINPSKWEETNTRTCVAKIEWFKEKNERKKNRICCISKGSLKKGCGTNTFSRNTLSAS
eukprot:TRINITY_DN973_c0_g1_i1.p2 TRINITY_DN973_c0_g1~~TRINITY_DN973_c0_g1_i1.p2  ORF type:complete len:113 (-),score=21.65 TRINITY_DN973_c0_g1_i1:2920-3258(-)